MNNPVSQLTEKRVYRRCVTYPLTSTVIRKYYTELCNTVVLFRVNKPMWYNGSTNPFELFGRSWRSTVLFTISDTNFEEISN